MQLQLLLICAAVFASNLKCITISVEHNSYCCSAPELQQYVYAKQHLDRHLKTVGDYTHASQLLCEMRQNNLPAFSEIKECDCTAFDRTKHPELRGYFEENILQLIQKNIRPDLYNRQITITFFGSGKLFQTLLLTTKLIDSGFSNLRINLVDRAYIPFFVDRQPRYRVPIPGSGDESFGPEYIEDVQFKPHQLSTEYPLTTKQTENLLTQFLHWFSFVKKICTPDSTLECNIYTNISQYKTEISQGKNTQSDILVAADVKMCDVEEDLTQAHRNLLKNDGVYGYLIGGNFREIESCGVSPISYIPEKISQKTQMRLACPIFTYVGIKH